MSLESDRRAIGARNEGQRRGIGQRMINDRQNIRAGISAARASTFKADLNTLETAPRKQVSFNSRDPKGARPATVGTGSYKAPPAAASSGGGIASPLTEVELDGFGDREYWPAMIQETTDGLLTFEVRPIKKWKFLDADGNAAALNIAKPALTL